MTSETYIDQLASMSHRIAELFENAEEMSSEKSLVGAALQELSITIEELRVADEEIRRQAEELASAHDAIEDQRYRYEEMFEFAPDGYIITDVDGRIQEANRAASQLLNISQRLLVGKPLVTFIASEDRQGFFKELARLERTPLVREIDVRLQPRRADPFDAALTLGVVRDRRGEPTARRWLIRDATARRMAEENRYHRIVSEIADYAIFRLDMDGRIRSWNKGAEHLFGYAEQEVTGRHVGLIYTAEDRAQQFSLEEMQTAQSQGRSARYRWHVRKDGSRLWAENVVTALNDGSGRVTGFIKILRDHTEQKRAEDELSAAYERQHRIADTLQSSMLHKLPQNHFPGMEFDIRCQPALDEAHVGGDFFDTFALPGGKVALTLGDVSGKGLAAAARTTEVRYALRAFLDEHSGISDAVTRLNNYLCRAEPAILSNKSFPGSFVTLTIAVIDPASGSMEMVAAGAEGGFILRSDEVWQGMKKGGMPLGVELNSSYPVTEVQLGRGDVFLMATDGLTEVREGDGFLDQEGLARLALEIRREIGPEPPLDSLGRSLVERVTRLAGGSLRDDACLLLARRV